MAWTISIDPAALSRLSKFSKKHQRQITASIDRMRDDPFQGDIEALKGAEWQGRYRKRVARYRIFFSLNRQTSTITILTVELRSEKTYRT